MRAFLLRGSRKVGSSEGFIKNSSDVTGGVCPLGRGASGNSGCPACRRMAMFAIVHGIVSGLPEGSCLLGFRMSVLLSVQGLTKTFGVRPLFRDLSFDIREGERIGLIGPNGAGKSTLLKILVGREEMDAGTRAMRRSVKLGYVAQDDVFPEGMSVRQVVLAALADESIEEHERETITSIVLTQVGFDDDEKLASHLSGGWRKRLSIARAMALQPDIVLLDEPTNHLDLPGIVWLERLLRASSFGYVVATHDRAFLRAVADDILEISRVYPAGYFRATGSYDQFTERRDEFLEGQARLRESVANQVRRETEWLGRKAAARTRKAASRIDEAMDRRGELADLKARTTAAGAAGIDFVGTGRQSRKLLVAENVAKSMGGRRLFSGLELMLTPGSKLGLLGPNGSGKSVMLRTIAGEHKPDEGTVIPADGLRRVMFEQGRTALNPNQSLRRALCPSGDEVHFRGRPVHVTAWAKQFLFSVEQIDVLVGSLSGGEQARVRMAQMMLQPADLLLLDEPTNDLDIPALEVLEEALADFPGALVIVSHDRELLDRVCTEVIGLDGKGGSASYASVSQWLTALERAQRQATKAAQASGTKGAPVQPKARKLGFHEQKELDGMEATLLEAEETVAKLHAEVEASATAGNAILNAACKALEEAQTRVERLYQRWQELEGRRTAT